MDFHAIELQCFMHSIAPSDLCLWNRVKLNATDIFPYHFRENSTHANKKERKTSTHKHGSTPKCEIKVGNMRRAFNYSVCLAQRRIERKKTTTTTKNIVKQPTDTEITLNCNEWGKQRFWINLRAAIASRRVCLRFAHIMHFSSTLRFTHASDKLLQVKTDCSYRTWCIRAQ